MKPNPLLRLLTVYFALVLCGTESFAEDDWEKARRVLDSSILWPGDIRKAPSSEPEEFGAPSMSVNGTCHSDFFVLSAEKTKMLKEVRYLVVSEIGARLSKFDWHNPPKHSATAEMAGVAMVSQAVYHALEGVEPDVRKAWRPQNPLGFGSAVLQVIEALDAIEVLPELLRLEVELDHMNRKAVEGWGWTKVAERAREDSGYIPSVETYGSPVWIGRAEEVAAAKDANDWEIISMKDSIHKTSVFQCDVQSVCLAMMTRHGFRPLAESTSGRLRNFALRKAGSRNMALLGVNDEAGFRAHSASAGYQWDTALGVPISRSERVIIPHAVVESELRWLGHAFAEGREFTLQAGGGALLDQAIVAPGDFDQMCSSSPTIPDAVPLPRNFLLMLRSSILSENVLMKLALHRDSVIPVLKERLAVLKLGHVPPDGDDTKPREPLRNIVTYEGPMMQIIAGLQGIECLPELLKLEQRLFEIVDKMESDPSLPVPDFDFDNTYFYKGSKTEERRHGCKIVQREVLGLIKTLLLREGFQPLAESRFMAQEKNLKQTGPEKPNAPIFWQMPERDTLFGIPYSAEIRAELRGIAEQFLKSVPPEKWKAGSGIQLPFFDKP